jgi:ribose 5-phosphate isomerase B
MKIALACDHGGFPLKEIVAQEITNAGHSIIDCGTDSPTSVDYPDFAAKACRKIQTGDADRGIIICGSGVGANIAANKFRGIFASVCHDTYTAHQGVEHDNMNVICLGARVIGPELAKEIVQAFLHASFSDEERHIRRVDKIRSFEK